MYESLGIGSRLFCMLKTKFGNSGVRDIPNTRIPEIYLEIVLSKFVFIPPNHSRFNALKIILSLLVPSATGK